MSRLAAQPLDTATRCTHVDAAAICKRSDAAATWKDVAEAAWALPGFVLRGSDKLVSSRAGGILGSTTHLCIITGPDCLLLLQHTGLILPSGLCCGGYISPNVMCT